MYAAKLPEERIYTNAGRPQPYSYTKEKELYDSIKSAHDFTEIQGGIEQFYDSLSQISPLQMVEVHELTIRLLIGMENRMFAEFGNEERCNIVVVLSVVRKATLQEVKQYVLECCKELREVFLESIKNSHTSIIVKTIQNMEKEFQHATLRSLAQKVYMTPSYLSLLFKMNTGTTFIEKLTDIRINRAKHLLRSTRLKNYEVAESIGYQDPRYFSQIFKKKVGLSPSDYRDSPSKNLDIFPPAADQNPLS
jgi:two-component system response regulator YesN